MHHTPPRSSGRESACLTMKRHVIHHSNIERGTIRFHRHGVPRVTLRDMLTHPLGHCGNCITGASSSLISCHSTPEGYNIRLGFRNTSGTIRVYPLSQAKEHVTICKLYDLARVFTSTTLADAPKETRPRSNKDASTGFYITELVWDEVELCWLVNRESEGCS